MAGLVGVSCWQAIGVWGDRTCEKLEKYAHCHHCQVYSAGGARLLQRPAPTGYSAEQTQQVSEPLAQHRPEHRSSMLIFRLELEWFALPARLCQQILSPVAAHVLPHRSDRILLGIVNVRGQLLLKVSLKDLLGIATQAQTNLSPGPYPSAHNNATDNRLENTKSYPRMVVVEKPLAANFAVETKDNRDIWVFDVDELQGIHAVDLNQLEMAATMTAGTETFTRHILPWQDQRVNVLEDTKLFESLRQQVL